MGITKNIQTKEKYLYLTMMTEGAYREYEDDGQYRWVKPLFEASWKELRDIIQRKLINMQQGSEYTYKNA